MPTDTHCEPAVWPRQLHPIEEFMAALTLGPAKLESCKSYCDRIGAAIFDALKARDPEGIIVSVGPVKSDLHPTGGYLLSTKKTLEVEDKNGNRYRVTVEDLRDVKEAV